MKVVLEPKARWCGERGLAVRWHFLGHLQRNKARRIVRAVDVLHSVDSLRLVETLARVCAEEDRRLDVYLQVNCTGEEQKHGLDPSALHDAARLVAGAAALVPAWREFRAANSENGMTVATTSTTANRNFCLLIFGLL